MVQRLRTLEEFGKCMNFLSVPSNYASFLAEITAITANNPPAP
jgi:hypothetical protein